MTSLSALSAQDTLSELLDSIIMFAKSCGTGRTSRGVNGGRGGRGAGSAGGGRGPDGEPIRPDIRGNPANITFTDEEVRRNLVKSLREQGFSDEEIRAALAVAYTESKVRLIEENDFGGTSNERIRSIFSSTRSLTDAELTNLKQDRTAFFNYVYNRRNGNILENDGSAFLGRGAIQLTGRENYERYGRLAGYGDLLVRQPELMITDQEISTKVTAAYLRDRYDSETDGGSILERMRWAVSGTQTGYDISIGSDKTAIQSIDQSWLE